MQTKISTRRKIRTRILFAFLGLSLVTLLILAFVSLQGMKRLGAFSTERNTGLGQESLRISKKALENLAQAGLLRIASDQAALCNTEFEEIEAMSNTLASYAAGLWNGKQERGRLTYGIGERPPDEYYSSVYLTAPEVPVGSVKREVLLTSNMDELFKPMVRNNPNISVIQMGTPSGLFRRFPWSGDFPAGYDHRGRDWYKSALQYGKPGWTDPYVSAIKNELRINCYNPVYDSKGSLATVIGIAVSLKTINERIINTHLDKKGRAILVSRQLKVVAREGLKSGKNWEDPVKGEYFSLEGPLDGMRQLRTQLAAGRTGILKGIYEGRESLVAYAPVASTRWAFLMVLPIEDVVAPVRKTEDAILAQVKGSTDQVNTHIRQTLTIFAAVFSVMLIAVAAVSYLTANRIVAPILELDRGAKTVGSGNLDYRFKLRTGDEIEELANTFNKMTSDLQTYIADLKETTAAKERIQSELKVATEIQLSVLPRVFPPFPDRPEFDVYAIMDPAKEVGGDLYDFFFVDERHFCILIGDVSGKGVPAALFMMVTKALLKTEVLREPEPDKVLFRVNNVLCPDNDNCMFATIFCAVLNTETGELRFSNAGHNPPVLLSGGKAEFIGVPQGVALGAMEDSAYSARGLVMKKGDSIFLYTDGVTEAENPLQEFFGEERLLSALATAQDTDVTKLISGLRTGVRNFSDGAVQSDDITMLALRFNVQK